MIQSVTIGATVSLGNYESMRLEVQAENAEEAKQQLREILLSVGTGPTKDLIDKYIRRVSL